MCWYYNVIKWCHHCTTLLHPHPSLSWLNKTKLMQPSMGTLNSPSWRVVKDSTPSRRWILRCINFGIGESSLNLFLNMVNLYLVRFEARWILDELALHCFIIHGESWPRTNKLARWIFTQLHFCGGESWPNDFVVKVNRGEDLRWVDSRCPLTHV